MKEATCKKKLKHEWQAIRKNKDISHTLNYLVWDIIVLRYATVLPRIALCGVFALNSKSLSVQRQNQAQTKFEGVY